VFIEDPLVNSMASFNSSVVPEEGVTFIFGSWVGIANGQGSFNSHVASPKEQETITRLQPRCRHSRRRIQPNLVLLAPSSF
jgi:hypothetical protein